MSSKTRTSIAFVCVQNAGRSQMAAAFAEREVEERSVKDQIQILTGGTQPADHVHNVVVEAMDEEGFDLADNTPREITSDELENIDIVITMGCSADNICPMTWRGNVRDWALDDPSGQSLESVREIRDDIKRRVSALFDELRSMQRQQ